jgi:hypothetical protein
MSYIIDPNYCNYCICKLLTTTGIRQQFFASSTPVEGGIIFQNLLRKHSDPKLRSGSSKSSSEAMIAPAQQSHVNEERALAADYVPMTWALWLPRSRSSPISRRDERESSWLRKGMSWTTHTFDGSNANNQDTWTIVLFSAF